MAALNKYWASLGHRRWVVRASQWFQQDWATPHTANETIAWLRQRFEERLIISRCDDEWAPHSSDLNPQIFICRVSSQTMYTWEIPQTIEELKTTITAKIRAIPKDECVKVIGSLVRRVLEKVT